MSKWSVLLLYPDYLRSDDPAETFYTSVEAKTVRHAVRRAAIECIVSNMWAGTEENPSPVMALSDFRPLLVIEGEHNDRAWEA
jgi:hypothetical protein